MKTNTIDSGTNRHMIVEGNNVYASRLPTLVPGSYILYSTDGKTDMDAVEMLYLFSFLDKLSATPVTSFCSGLADEKEAFSQQIYKFLRPAVFKAGETPIPQGEFRVKVPGLNENINLKVRKNGRILDVRLTGVSLFRYKDGAFLMCVTMGENTQKIVGNRLFNIHRRVFDALWNELEFNAETNISID